MLIQEMLAFINSTNVQSLDAMFDFMTIQGMGKELVAVNTDITKLRAVYKEWEAMSARAESTKTIPTEELRSALAAAVSGRPM